MNPNTKYLILVVSICLSLQIASGLITPTEHVEEEEKRFLGITSTSTSYGSSKNKDSPVASFIIGLLMLIFSFPILWNNERKLVKIGQFLEKGEKECIEVHDPNHPSDE
jgi:hypothetical protein